MSEKLKKRIAGMLAKRLLAWLVSQAPILAIGPINVIASFLLEKLMIKTIELTFLGGILAYIFLDTRRDLNEVEKIIKEINLRVDDITEEELSEYDKRLAKAGRDLIQYGSIG